MKKAKKSKEYSIGQWAIVTTSEGSFLAIHQGGGFWRQAYDRKDIIKEEPRKIVPIKSPDEDEADGHDDEISGAF